MTTTEQPMNREMVTSISEAFQILGIRSRSISTFEEINVAFRRCAREADAGNGTFHGDMDRLTQAKAFLSCALTKALEQAQSDQARQRAQQQEQEEHQQSQARQRQQKEESTKTVKTPKVRMVLLGPAKNQNNNWEALRSYEHACALEREQARRIWSYQVSQQQERHRQQHLQQSKMFHQQNKGGERAMQQPSPEESQQQQQVEPIMINDDPIQSALALFQARRGELQQTRQREDELRSQLESAQRHRSQLEQTLLTADVLAQQLNALLIGNESTELEHPKN